MAVKTIPRSETPASRVASMRAAQELEPELPWDEAPCRAEGANPDDWYPVTNPSGINSASLQAKLSDSAAELCAGCPFAVKRACRVLGEDEPWGIWGGETAFARQARREALSTASGLAVAA